MEAAVGLARGAPLAHEAHAWSAAASRLVPTMARCLIKVTCCAHCRRAARTSSFHGTALRYQVGCGCEQSWLHCQSAGGAAGSVGFISWDMGAVAESKRFCASPTHDSVLRATGARNSDGWRRGSFKQLRKMPTKRRPHLCHLRASTKTESPSLPGHRFLLPTAWRTILYTSSELRARGRDSRSSR